jgi:histidyl-tRNA synthetase
VAEVVSAEARHHVQTVEHDLESLGVEVRRAPRLVRGIDYYLRTVFEVIAPELGEDTVICGGGRYDRLVSDLGGAEVPGIGFAIGEDRLVEVLPESFRTRVLERSAIAVLPIDQSASSAALGLTRDLARAGLGASCEVTGRSLKAGFKWAGKIGARVAVILGENELAQGTAVVRDLARSEQEIVALGEVVEHVQGLLESN